MTKTLNQCDGCRRDLPLHNGLHRGDTSWDIIGCTAHLYENADVREPVPWQIVHQAVRALGNESGRRRPEINEEISRAFRLVLDTLEQSANVTRFDHPKLIDVAFVEHLEDWPKLPAPPPVASEKQKALREENAELRVLLALRCLGAHLYTDDGELIDGSVTPWIDYKRDSPVEIRRKWAQRAQARLELTQPKP